MNENANRRIIFSANIGKSKKKTVSLSIITKCFYLLEAILTVK
jgi:hypothetical protein